MLTFYVGFDSREPRSFEVTKKSLGGLRVEKLEHRALRRRGLFTRPWTITSEGQFVDQRDGKPFSTEFSFTRFLVPTLAKEAQVGRYVAFVDGDFLFQEDPRNILDVVKAYRAPVYVVKHDYLPTERYKMDGMLQSAYGCKLWSSLMLFDLENPLLRNLTPERVNQMPGFALHQFKWLPSIDDVEALDPRWNVLTHKPWTGPVGAYHYTLGTPELKEDCPHAEEWLAMEKRVV